MTKLIIQIPCYNEQDSLGITLSELPESVPGVDVVEWLIIDDGSTDRTVQVARRCGVDHIIQLSKHQGLARCFMAGLDACLERGADIIVNTDADNQYCAADIPRLIAPIVDGEADLVVGARPIDEIRHFSYLKKRLQRFGSWVVRRVSGTNVPDAASGFRAYSRTAAMRLQLFQQYSHTLESIIQCGRRGMAVTWIPIRTNSELRPSRLIRSVRSYLTHSAVTILRSLVTYRPLLFFSMPGFALVLLGLLLGVRYLAFYFAGQGGGHVQSVIVGGALISLGVLFLMTALLADLIAVNRQMLERIDWQLKQLADQCARDRRSDFNYCGEKPLFDESTSFAADDEI